VEWVELAWRRKNIVP